LASDQHQDKHQLGVGLFWLAGKAGTFIASNAQTLNLLLLTIVIGSHRIDNHVFPDGVSMVRYFHQFNGVTCSTRLSMQARTGWTISLRNVKFSDRSGAAASQLTRY